MTYIFPLATIGVIIVAYLVYMKFYYPKFKEQSMQFQYAKGFKRENYRYSCQGTSNEAVQK